MVKQQVSWTIDKEILKLIKEDAKLKKRSDSYIVNEILLNCFKKKE